ncbi:MAG: deoxyribodipyrimidine photo-lyase [Flavobacterium sp.]|nr:deoxyribodipyrimidine photo-lyase [Flavobacterium sp.]
MTLFWFRRDLRLNDNRALFHALTDQTDVLPLFIFDTTILNQLEKQDARVNFIHELLTKIQTKLQQNGKSLAVFHGNPVDIFAQLIAKHPIQAVYANRDYEPNARKRDKAIFELLATNNIPFQTYKDQVIFEKNEVVKDDGLPYVVYTPYANKWKSKLQTIQLNFTESENHLQQLVTHNYPFLSLEDIGFNKPTIQVVNFDVSEQLIDQYEQTRNFPALNKTSFLGAHLRFGAVSIREMVQKARKSAQPTFLNELIWREFFMQILWHFPHTAKTSFKPKYDAIQWNNNEADFKKWCNGQTGYPFVDAGMRELNATGHMHNRVRMIVASFLCKHLLIDWRWGETYFAQKLLDYEQASNVGNWQWAAGSGVDAAPYFRIFNPSEQIKKFDNQFEYIKKWVPELNELSYPSPIIDHKFARERCLQVYKAAVG